MEQYQSLVSRRMPVLFSVSGAQPIPGIHGSFNIDNDAAGVVIVAARRLDRPGVVAMLGTHIMSPAWLPAAPLEERVAKVLRTGGIEIPLSHRMPATLPLPSGLMGNSVPVVVLTLESALGHEWLETIGGALRQLRDEGVVLIGIAPARSAAGGSELRATVSLLMGAAYDDDYVAELGTRAAGGGFILVAEMDDSMQDEGCCFWDVEGAGEMPREVLEQLRPYLLHEEPGENREDMKKKKASAIHVTRFDKARLTRLLRSLDAAHENREEIEDLERELERGTEVESTEVGPDVVTMNSTVRVTDLDASTTHLYTIVFPSDADFDKGRISILSPLGTALLGYCAGDVVIWEMPRGTRRLRIEELVYQPEAAGDFHL